MKNIFRETDTLNDSSRGGDLQFAAKKNEQEIWGSNNTLLRNVSLSLVTQRFQVSINEYF